MRSVTVGALFSEVEAAMLLGVSIERLRSLVQDRILDGDLGNEDPDHQAMTFSRSDLVVLRVLASQSLTAA
jgi:hypothetical protein